MSEQTGMLVQANERLKDHFSRDRSNDYDAVQVLLLYWEKSDSAGYRQEAIELEELFVQKFHYQVQRFEIPAKNSHLRLNTQVNSFLTLLLGRRSLGIIHYGGHGDEDVRDGGLRRSVWGSHNDPNHPDDSTLVWSDTQPALTTVDADILLILDCCFAAQTARDRDRVIPNNVELLAACAMNLRTPPPLGNQSFTACLIKEIQIAIDTNGTVVVKDIHSLLSRQDGNLTQTPVYYPPRSDKSIRLDPLLAKQIVVASVSDMATVSLRMDIDAALSLGTLDGILRWLTLNAPRFIAGIEITELLDRASKIQDFITTDESAASDTSRMRMSKLPESSKSHIQRAFSGFISKTALSAAAAASDTNNAESGFTFERFVDSFKLRLSNLQRTVSRYLLAQPEFEKEKVLKMEAQSPEAKDLDLVDVLQVRLASLQEVKGLPPLGGELKEVPEQIEGAGKAVVMGELEDLGRVLIEYKYLDASENSLVDANKDRVQRLLSALISARSDSFCTPECLGYLVDDLGGRYGFVFQPPSGSVNDAVPLHHLLNSHLHAGSTINKPTLGQRFRLAIAIGRAIAQWHLCGWVHQSVASYNIFLFYSQEKLLDYSNPYLIGFEYSREYDETSVQRLHNTKLADIYRHPDRQGELPKKLHTKYHDIYSFGLLLLEIGLWEPIDATFKTVINKKGPSQLRHAITTKCRGLLAHSMGLSYERAALLCLSGSFGIEKDDKNATALGEKFESEVLGQLETGIHLDELFNETS